VETLLQAERPDDVCYCGHKRSDHYNGLGYCQTVTQGSGPGDGLCLCSFFTPMPPDPYEEANP
jgi:hypothetical protein